MTINFGHTAWILTSTALVLFMTLPGLALFYGGLVRSKNTISVLAQCFLIATLTSIIWVVVGYSLSFSGEGLYIGNFDKFLLKNINITSLTGEIPELLFVMFQMTFAIITPALIIGAFVERIKFSAVFLFTLLWVVFVYVPVAHWVWGNGWLAKKGVLDFAGGLVVHTTAGVSSLVIAYFLGRRKGFPKIAHPPHSPVLAMIGASMLWVGWFGFNAGSALAANGNAAMAMLVTHSSAATATLTWMCIDWYKNGKPGLIGIITGMVAGLATVTPASGYIGPMGGIILGLLSGFICYWFVGFIKFKLKIDDSLDVFAVHGVGGILGTLLAGILATNTFGGLGIEKSAFDQTIVQFIGVISVAIFALVVTIIIVKIIQATIGLRVSSQQEEFDGLDLGSHGEKSYNL
ncbi:MAG: ammonium transporter [Proteobacteria bacterium]|jgi:Amt family ammonium transporter|nr:ammonium transporter [Candidatus Fonsibacter sp. PEL3]